MYSVIQMLDNMVKYILKESNLLNKEAGDDWIKHNVFTNINQYWVILTNDIERL